jgi:DnaB-like helicase C terminal domain
MSVENLVISKLVEDGSIKKAFQEGISEADFELHDDEWNWLVQRAIHRKPINPRLFKRQFPEFDYAPPREKLIDLLDELKQERAYLAISSSIEEVFTSSDPLSQDNAVDKAVQLRDALGEVLKLHSPYSDIALKSGWERGYERIKSLSILRQAGEAPGLRTGITHFDHHFGGLQKETSYLFLGRPGDAKSFTIAKFAAETAWDGYRCGLFSPEMTEHQHNCRVHTLLSAKKEIQQALGLGGAFRNRALKNGYGFNLKLYRHFLQYLDEQMKGEIHLFTQRYRREKMSVSYIETRIEDYGLDLVIVDPIYKLRPPKRRGTRAEEIADITDALIDLAHSYNIPVVMTNQAGRALVGTRGLPPTKDASHGSDAPAQEANCVVGVKHVSEEHVMKYNCSKNRDGEEFKFTAKFHPNVGVIEDITPLGGNQQGYDRDVLQEATTS